MTAGPGHPRPGGHVSRMGKNQPTLTTCDACRTPQEQALLERRTIEKVEITICRDQRPCIWRAKKSLIWQFAA